MVYYTTNKQSLVIFYVYINDLVKQNVSLNYQPIVLLPSILTNSRISHIYLKFVYN